MIEKPSTAGPKVDQDFVWVRHLSKIMDSKFNIGGFRFGWDPLLNFIPFAGQTITLGTSLLLVLIMYRNGVSPKAAAKMMINVLIDTVLGSIPLLGNIFDFVHKANQKNIKILEEYYYEGKHQGGATRIFLTIAVVFLLFSIISIYLFWKLSSWILGMLGIF